MKPVEVLGVPGSPYTRKMIALLRYRRIAHRVVWGSHFQPPSGYPAPKVALLPTVYFHTQGGREAVVDSTPIIRRLEDDYRMHEPERSVRPDDELLRFLDLLIEDYADEWLTKAMFHYRWHFEADARNAGPLLALWNDLQLDAGAARASAAMFARRQIDRLPVVGSSPATAPVIEASYRRLIGILDRIIERQGFVLGTRPCSADFALYGQLTQLGQIDPTPRRLLEQASPRLRAWLDRVEDLSGHPVRGWLARDLIADHLGELLGEIGQVYAPFLLANARAIAAGQATFEAVIDGRPWSQAVFPYQAKCLATLRQAREDLGTEERQTLDRMLAGTGCEALFAH